MKSVSLDIQSTARRVAYLEDDVITGNIIKTDLVEMGFEVDWFESGLDCIRAIRRKRYDVCVLDWSVPDVSGSEVLRSIKTNATRNELPIIFLTSRSGEADIINMLESGADDYICKPILSSILGARINSLLRRSGCAAQHEIKVLSGLTVDFTDRKFYIENTMVDLTHLEKSLALLLIENLNELVTRSHILKVVWGHNHDVETRKIDVTVSSLRKKLFLFQHHGWQLSSVYGLGYMLEHNESKTAMPTPEGARCG